MTKKSADKALIDTLASLGRWLAGVSGIGVVIAASLVVNSYAVFESDFKECGSRLLVSDAMHGGFKYMLGFVISGLLSIFAVAAPYVARRRHYLMEKRREYDTGERFVPWYPTERLGNWQFYFIVGAFSFLLIVIIGVCSTYGHFSPRGLGRLETSVRNLCLRSTSVTARPNP